MTISSEVCAVTYPGNGVTTHWVFNFLVPSDSGGNGEVFVVMTDAAGAVTFIDPSLYNISGLNNPSGGAVDYPVLGTPLAVGATISIIRGQPYTQEIAVSNQAFFPHTVEELGDLLTMQTQQLNEKFTRTLQAPPGEPLLFLPSKILRANKVLGFNALGQPIATTAGGGGGSSDWNALFNVPVLITTIQGLVPAAGKIIEFTGAGAAHLINTPSGTVTSVNGFIGAVVLGPADVGAAPTVHTHVYTAVTNFGDGVNAKLLAGTNVTFSFAAGVTTINATAGGGSMLPVLMSTFAAIDGGGVNTANNDTAITAAEADAQKHFYWPEGTFKTTLDPLLGNMSKGYQGYGLINFGASFYPAKISALGSAVTPATTGLAGFFKGDQRFTDGGEYKYLGPNIGRYDLAQIYYQSTFIPHFAWYDNYGGNSGGQALLINGAAAGAFTITVPGGGDAAWVGKTCAFANSFGGASIETKVVASVTGTTVTFTTALANTYTWNPNAGLSPNMFFAPRSWHGHTYIKVKAKGGGDTYGHIVRTTMEYIPNASEKIHTFMTGTAGQYGGDVNFLAGTDGTYATSLEFSAADAGNDVAYIGEVYSYSRNNDTSGVTSFIAGKAPAGRTWFGGRHQSAGLRPVDAGYVFAGNWRNIIDTALAITQDTTVMRDPAVAGAFGFSVYNLAGAVAGKTVVVSDGVHTYTGVIASLSPGIHPGINLVTALNFNYAAGSQVTYTGGGAIINAAVNQKIIWNSTSLNDQQGTDYVPRGAGAGGFFGAGYGNVPGDIETGTEEDAPGDGGHWYTKYTGNGHSGAIAKIRLYATDFRCNVKIQGGTTIEAAKELTTAGLTADPNMTGAVVFGPGSGNMLRFNSALNRFEMVKANVVVQTW